MDFTKKNTGYIYRMLPTKYLGIAGLGCHQKHETTSPPTFSAPKIELFWVLEGCMLK